MRSLASVVAIALVSLASAQTTAQPPPKGLAGGPAADAAAAKPADDPHGAAALRATLAGLYGDLVVAKARWDATWAAGVSQTPKTALANLAGCSREFLAVVQRRADLESRFATLSPGLLTPEDRDAILESLQSLERIARAHDDADYEYRIAPTEGGPTPDVAQKAWRAQRERLNLGLRETEQRLRRPAGPKADFDAAVPALAWAVPLLDRFKAIPDLDLAAPRVGTAYPGSPLAEGDVLTGIRHAGDPEFTPIDGWAAAKAFWLANLDKPGRLELRVTKAGAERTVPEPTAPGPTPTVPGRTEKPPGG